MRISFKKLFSPVFAVMLLVSLVMWYISKLGYTYTTEMPVMVNIEGQRFKVDCVVEGKGVNLLAHRYYRHNAINLKLKDLSVTPSSHTHGYIISPYSLQNALSVQSGDIRIVSVNNIPEITSPDISDKE